MIRGKGKFSISDAIPLWLCGRANYVPVKAIAPCSDERSVLAPSRSCQGEDWYSSPRVPEKASLFEYCLGPDQPLPVATGFR